MKTTKLKSNLKQTAVSLFRKSLHLKKYIAWRDRPYAAAAILLGFLNHFLYQLSGSAFCRPVLPGKRICLGTFETDILPNPICIHSGIPKIPSRSSPVLLLPFSGRPMRHGSNPYTVLYLYGNHREKFSIDGYFNLFGQHPIRLLYGRIFL